MRVADIAGLPIQAGAALRGARLFHPDGVLAKGTLTRTAADGVGLPMADCDVVARVSKGVGMPGTVPDVLGLAIRMPPHPGDHSPWDVLLAGAAGTNVIARTIPFPARALGNAVLSSLQPLHHDGGSWWLRARVTPETPQASVSVENLRTQIDGAGLVFDIEQAHGTGPFEPLARVTLSESVDEADYPNIGFDPTVNTTRDVDPEPNWLSGTRKLAYRYSRKGRAAEG
ncbi:phosphodiesterase [Williamsia muralis]|uniref:Phosphodiesterase n=1 Tax=Williamsia marianensis TaxID=85044 RepID=A0A2G3PR16_WILMA|nr:phosphodiesterase [Williamsia marianensis]PHV68299.1 phosphodiesterase [Williamsia marianensis]